MRWTGWWCGCRSRSIECAWRTGCVAYQRAEVRYCRNEGGTRLALKPAKATEPALAQLEVEPGLGLPRPGLLLDIPGLKTWRVSKFLLLSCYFERADHLDVVRLLGERQDILAVLPDDVGSD